MTARPSSTDVAAPARSATITVSASKTNRTGATRVRRTKRDGAPPPASKGRGDNRARSGEGAAVSMRHRLSLHIEVRGATSLGFRLRGMDDPAGPEVRRLGHRFVTPLAAMTLYHMN